VKRPPPVEEKAPEPVAEDPLHHPARQKAAKSK